MDEVKRVNCPPHLQRIPLVVIPVFLSEDGDEQVLIECFKSIRRTVSDSVEIMAVDDCSPRQDLVDIAADFLFNEDKGYSTFDRREQNEGFSRTVNVGLRKALEEGRDAVLMNADIVMKTPGWVKRCQKTTDPEGNQAAVVGALLTYPSGLIQHAGIYFSMLTRVFDHCFKFGPANLKEALEKRPIPVTGAFQYIRHETLENVGLYDEDFRMAHEDVDFCIRVMEAGLYCVYNPNIRAVHHEQMFRGRASKKVAEWTAQSWLQFCRKYKTKSFGHLVPNY
jgi:GT2 family glycosyltransferase